MKIERSFLQGISLDFLLRERCLNTRHVTEAAGLLQFARSVSIAVRERVPDFNISSNWAEAGGRET